MVLVVIKRKEEKIIMERRGDSFLLRLKIVRSVRTKKKKFTFTNTRAQH